MSFFFLTLFDFSLFFFFFPFSGFNFYSLDFSFHLIIFPSRTHGRIKGNREKLAQIIFMENPTSISPLLFPNSIIFFLHSNHLQNYYTPKFPNLLPVFILLNFAFMPPWIQPHQCRVGACSSEKKLQASSPLKKLCSSIFGNIWVCC